MYKLYDPEIATNDLTDKDDKDELYFCSGNLSVLAIGTFRKEHTCNCYCRMMKLEEIVDSEAAHSGDENKAQLVGRSATLAKTYKLSPQPTVAVHALFFYVFLP